ncbi:vWA domain-containing protein [Butyrivibrio sp. VCB2006]|uniref:vWA domain-containing protein n=1 Tax=Butyrivibrio sp. VCB2006 TaxID=1280679 RepID=UPI000404B91B|nr:VWA domain-containing protein [Butyrivibrio sp. VCB2006]
MGLKDVVIKEARPLPVLLLVDNSGSMANEKINTVNVALKEMIAEFNGIKNAKGKISVGIITFGNTVEIVQPIKRIEETVVPEFQAAGKTWMGEAIDKAIDMLEDRNQVPERAYTPTIILLSDGLPSDCPGRTDPKNYDFSQWEPLQRLHSSERLKKCPKLALGIGDGTNYRMLNAFINNPEVPVIKANDLATITKFFQWVTYSISKRSVSSNPNEPVIGDPKEMFGVDEVEYLLSL